MRRRLAALALVLLLMLPLAQGAVTWGSKQDVDGKTATSVTLNRPSGTAAGDLFVAHVVVEAGSSLAITPPAGWTLHTRTQAGSIVSAIYWRIATSTEASSYRFDFSASVASAAAIGRFRGAEVGAPIEAVSNAAGTGTTLVAPSVTASAAGNILLLLCGAQLSTNWPTPSGMSERWDRKTTRVSTQGSTRAASAGATGTSTCTASSSAQLVAHHVLIREVPAPTISFDVGTSSAVEGSGAVSLHVTLSRQSAKVASVSYAVTGGTALAGEDYSLVAGTLTIPAGATSGTITATVTDDAIFEPNETFVVTLSAPTGATLGAIATRTHVIVNDDARPSVAFESAASAGLESVTSAAVRVRLSQATTETVHVAFALSGGSATAGADHAFSTGALTLAPGATMGTLTLPVVNDRLHETDETVAIALTGATNATLGEPAGHTYTIRDDDAAPRIAFLDGDEAVVESAGTLLVEVRLLDPTALPASVAWSVVGGSAEAGVDHAATPGVLHFAPGAASASLSLALLDDAVFEGDEDIHIALGSPVNATLGTPSLLVVTLLDDEAEPTVRFNSSAGQSAEGAGETSITVLLSPASADEVRVSYRAIGGTATPGIDHVFTDGTLVFAPGQQSLRIPLLILQDEIPEGDETLVVELHDPANATLGAVARHVRTIVDDDLPFPTVSFERAASSQLESVAEPEILVRLSAPDLRSVQVRVAATTGTALAGSDFLGGEATLTFAPGETLARVPLVILDDSAVEPDETLVLTLSAPLNAVLGSQTQHTYTIRNDDLPPPTVAFEAASAVVVEGGASAAIPVVLSRAIPQESSVAWRVSGGSASPGPDFGPVSGTLSFPPGITRTFLTLAIVDDDLIEESETIALALESPVRATLGTPSVFTLTVADDDEEEVVLPTLSFQSGASNGAEASSPALVGIALSAPALAPVHVSVSAIDGTAANGRDYSFATQTVSFAIGESAKTISVPILDNHVHHGDRYFSLVLGGAVGATLGATTTHVRTILDDDLPLTQELVVAATPVLWDGTPDNGAPWGGWSAQAGSASVASRNYLKITNTGTVATPRVVVSFSASTFTGAQDAGFAIPLSSNLEFAWWEDTTPGSSAPSEGQYAWTDGGAAGSTTLTFTGTGHIAYVAYRIKQMPSILPEQPYRASFTVTEL